MRWFFCLSSSAAAARARSRADAKARLCSSRRRLKWCAYVTLLHACRRVGSVMPRAATSDCCLGSGVACLSARSAALRIIASSRGVAGRLLRRVKTPATPSSRSTGAPAQAQLRAAAESSSLKRSNSALRPSRATELRLRYKIRTAHHFLRSTAGQCVSSHPSLCVQQCMLSHR